MATLFLTNFHDKIDGGRSVGKVQDWGCYLLFFPDACGVLGMSLRGSYG